jgi:hypothetical protein
MGHKMRDFSIAVQRGDGRDGYQRTDRQTKDALKIHARNCTRPGWCNYSETYDWVIMYTDYVKHCEAAVQAEGAAYQIRMHRAAIRKIKELGRALRIAEKYDV